MIENRRRDIFEKHQHTKQFAFKDEVKFVRETIDHKSLLYNFGDTIQVVQNDAFENREIQTYDKILNVSEMTV